MPSDPYAQYLTPPSSAPASASSGGNDPYAQYLTPPGAAKAAPAQSNSLDYSNSPWSARLRTLLSSGSLGASDLIGAGLQGTSVAQQRAMDTAAAQSLPWYERYPIEAAGYGLGAGALLTPVGEAAAAGAAGTGVGEALGLASGLGRTAVSMGTQGGLAGGISSGLQGENPISGAATGAVLGAGAGALTRGVNVGLQKALGTKATVDPNAAIAQTAQKSAQTYAQGSQFKIDPTDVGQAISSPMSNLDPSVETGLSGGFKSQYNAIRQALIDQHTQGNQVDANMVDSWQRQLNEAASSSTDGKVAGQINSSLDQLLKTSGAGQWQQDAQTAFKQKAMAENLAEWQRKTAAGADIGQAPLTEAEKFYQGTPEYQPLANLYSSSQKPPFIPSALGHIAANAMGAAGGAIAGFPGAAIGEGLGYLYVKPAIYKAMKGVGAAQKAQKIQQLYPQYTGVQPTGGVQGPQVGNYIRNLMMGAAY